MLKYEFPISSGGGGDCTGETYTNLMPTPINVGGITIGDTFNNKTMSQMFDLLLYPEMFPTLTAPSTGFSLSQAGLHEINETIAILNFAASFNRGSISPAYGTSGFRSGLPVQYNYGGGLLPATVATTNLTNNQTLSNFVVTIGNRTQTMTVGYSQGEQPLSSKGNLYNSPLPVGTTGSRSVTITGVYPYFATTVNITTLTKQPLALMNSSYVQTNVVPEANPNKQIVDFPISQSAITGIQFYNTVSSTWEWINGSKANSLTTFTLSSTTYNVQGITINYRRYVHNGSLTGSRQLRWYTT